MTREDWLMAALPKIKDLLISAPDFPTPLFSIGLPHVRSLSAKQRAIGECWSTRCTDTGQATIFISPTLESPVEILAVLMHETIHAALNNKGGHRGRFAEIAKASGLLPPMTATTPGPDLLLRLHAIAADLGDMPHARLNATEIERERKKQTTRQRLYECANCGQKIRAAADDLSAIHIGADGELCGIFTLQKKEGKED
jgi:hypothetical protein